MKVVTFNEIKNELINNFRRQMLIPVIGSGFTRNCKSYNGRVPSGEDYRHYMIAQIVEVLHLTENEESELHATSFSGISTIYHKSVPQNAQTNYLKNNFYKVAIEEEKRNFLSIAWPYIYTLNIDDGIESNSNYTRVVYANRRINDQIFDDDKCVVKLHGDIHDMLTYADSKSEIFTQEQYVASLNKNDSLLSKLKHDGLFQNLLFVGCSLNDEIDLLSTLMLNNGAENITARYICLTQTPSTLEIIKYEQYGITHCIIFDSFNDIYSGLYSVGLEGSQISSDDLENYKSFSIEKLSSSYEANKPYLLFGKSLISKKRTITIPYFFISRDQSSQIINNFGSYNIQLLIGNRCSGKSYILADVACKVRDRDVFYFETKDRLCEQAFAQLLHKQNCVILADSNSFTIAQFESILENIDLLKNNGIYIVIAVNKNDRELSGILKLRELQSKIDSKSIAKIKMHNTFSESEIAHLNPLLTAIDAGIFNRKKTLVDNIIEISRHLSEKNKYHQVSPKIRTLRELAVLISLAIERKIYSSRATKLDFYEELSIQHKTTEPLIDCESTWSFERGVGDNSPVKYIANAEYWLYNQLERFAANSSNYGMIVDAYQYIIKQIIAQEGSPELLYGNKNISYREYILFDNINRLFSSYQTSGQNGIEIIRIIYEGLNDLLSVDPNYMHQRAKCYIKSSYYVKGTEDKLAYLDKAYRDANVAHQIFSHRYDECGNEKLLISIAHIVYTQALIACHKCAINSYSDTHENSQAIKILHQALFSPYNSYEFAKTDSFNYQNVVGQLVFTATAKKSLVLPDTVKLLEDLINLLNEKD